MSRPDTDNKATTTQTVDRTKGLGQGDRTSNDRQCNSRDQGHLATVGQHGSQRRGTVEPRDGEREMVIGRNCHEAQPSRRLGVANQVLEGERVVPEVHER
jgi:hypothetical protein